MNIFALSNCPRESAQMMCDRHVVKMATESMQMISTIMDLHGFKTPMKPVMLNHPCTIWARESSNNFEWLVNHCSSLCEEYTVRYNKTHKVEEHMKNYVDEIEQTAYEIKLNNGSDYTPFAIAISDDMQCRKQTGFDEATAIEKYRMYYLHDKWHFATWKTNSPDWWPNDWYKQKLTEQYRRDKNVRQMRKRNNNETNIIG